MNHLDKIKDILVKTLACDETSVTPDASIIDDLGADSLSMVELVMALEDAYGLTVSEEEAAEIKTVGDIARLIEARC